MNVLEPTPEHARRELAGIADALSEDDDLVVAYARAVWSCLVEPGDRVAGALIATCGPVRALEIAVATTGGAEVAHAAGIELGELDKARTRWHPRRGDVAERIAAARRAGARLVTPEDHAWPERVADLGPFAPVCLWVLGDVDDIHFAELTSADVVRHRLVGEIVDAYAKYEEPTLMNRAQRRASGQGRPRR